MEFRLKMKFRLNVHKLKCTKCDLIFLIEKKTNGHPPYWFSCPDCEGDDTEHMGDITVVQEDN